MALSERLAIIVDAQTGGAVREFDKVSKRVQGLGNDASGTTSKFDKFAGQMGVSSAALKAGLATAAVAAGGALVKFGVQAAQAASNLSEQISASQVVFGSASRSVVEFGSRAAGSIGLSKTAAIEAANVFGSFYGQIGLTNEQSALFSTTMVSLAGDIASFKNVAGGAAQVAQDLRSGLSGEAEPLRKYGIFLDEAKTKTKAFEVGLQSQNGELTDGAKIMARTQLILEQTTKAQGDYIRTQDSLANKQRTVNAAMADFTAQVGGVTAPIITELLTPIVALTAAMNATQVEAEGSSNAFQRFAGSSKGFLVAMGPAGAVLAGLNAVLGSGKDKAKDLAEAHKVYNQALIDGTEDSPAAVAAFAQIKAGAADLDRGQRALADATKTSDQRLKEFSSTILGAASAARGYTAAQQRIGDANRTVGERQRALNDLLRQGAVDAKQVASAARALESAQRGVASATQRVADVQQRLLEVQQRVNELRNPSADTAEGRAISLERAEIAVAEAKERLAAVEGDSESSAEDLASAKLDLRQAELDLRTEQRRGEDDARQLASAERDLTAAERDLASAERGVADAHRDTADAQASLAAAQAGDLDFAQKVEAAKRQLADAERGVGDAKFSALEASLKLIDAQKAENEMIKNGGDRLILFRSELERITALAPGVHGLLGLGRFDPGNPGASGPALTPLSLSPRAHGGPVSAGGAYMVGERGPEAFFPSSSGAIVPNGALGGSTTININMPPGSDGDAVVAALTRWQKRNGRLPLQVGG